LTLLCWCLEEYDYLNEFEFACFEPMIYFCVSFLQKNYVGDTGLAYRLHSILSTVLPTVHLCCDFIQYIDRRGYDREHDRLTLQARLGFQNIDELDSRFAPYIQLHWFLHIQTSYMSVHFLNLINAWRRTPAYIGNIHCMRHGERDWFRLQPAALMSNTTFNTLSAPFIEEFLKIFVLNVFGLYPAVCLYVFIVLLEQYLYRDHRIFQNLLHSLFFFLPAHWCLILHFMFNLHCVAFASFSPCSFYFTAMEVFSVADQLALGCAVNRSIVNILHSQTILEIIGNVRLLYSLVNYNWDKLMEDAFFRAIHDFILKIYSLVDNVSTATFDMNTILKAGGIWNILMKLRAKLSDNTYIAIFMAFFRKSIIGRIFWRFADIDFNTYLESIVDLPLPKAITPFGLVDEFFKIVKVIGLYTVFYFQGMSSNWFTYLSKVDKFQVRFSDLYLNPGVVNGVPCRGEWQVKVDELVQDIQRYRMCEAIDLTVAENVTLRTMYEKALFLQRSLYTKDRVLQPRAEPVGLLICGPPGCGKSTLIPTIVQSICEARGRTFRLTDIYYSDRSKYEDTLENFTYAYVIDDLGQKSSNIVKDVDTADYLKLIHIINTAPYVAIKAFEDKGCVAFTGDLVIATSNVTIEVSNKILNEITDIDALKRRLYTILVKLKPEFVDGIPRDCRTQNVHLFTITEFNLVTHVYDLVEVDVELPVLLKFIMSRLSDKDASYASARFFDDKPLCKECMSRECSHVYTPASFFYLLLSCFNLVMNGFVIWYLNYFYKIINNYHYWMFTIRCNIRYYQDRAIKDFFGNRTVRILLSIALSGAILKLVLTHVQDSFYPTSLNDVERKVESIVDIPPRPYLEKAYRLPLKRLTKKTKVINKDEFLNRCKGSLFRVQLCFGPGIKDEECHGWYLTEKLFVLPAHIFYDYRHVIVTIIDTDERIRGFGDNKSFSINLDSDLTYINRELDLAIVVNPNRLTADRCLIDYVQLQKDVTTTTDVFYVVTRDISNNIKCVEFYGKLMNFGLPVNTPSLEGYVLDRFIVSINEVTTDGDSGGLLFQLIDDHPIIVGNVSCKSHKNKNSSFSYLDVSDFKSPVVVPYDNTEEVDFHSTAFKYFADASIMEPLVERSFVKVLTKFPSNPIMALKPIGTLMNSLPTNWRDRMLKSIHFDDVMQFKPDIPEFMPPKCGKFKTEYGYIHNQVYYALRRGDNPNYVNHSIMKDVRNSMLEDVLSSPIFLTQPLTVDESINGIRGQKNIRRMQIHSSMGFGGSGKIADYCKIECVDGDKDHIIMPTFILNKVQTYLEDLSQGIVVPIFTKISPKMDEVIRPDKVLSGKTRNINIFPPFHNIAMRMYMLPIIDFLMRNWNIIGSAMGINATSLEWKDTLSHLIRGLKEPDFNALDHVSFELHEGAMFNWYVDDFFLQVAHHIGFNDHQCYILSRLLYQDTHVCNVILNDVILINNNNPSGSISTTVRNTTANDMSFRYVVALLITRIINDALRNYVRRKTYGDDLTVSRSIEIQKIFTYDRIKVAYSTIGFEVQPGSKSLTDTEFVPFWHESVTFLKRYFRIIHIERNGGFNIITAPLEEKSMCKSLLWYARSESVTAHSQYNQILSNVQRESWLHGKETFIKYTDFISTLIAKYHYDPILHDYDYYLDEYLRGDFTTYELSFC
jgi:hypothetical protein